MMKKKVIYTRLVDQIYASVYELFTRSRLESATFQRCHQKTHTFTIHNL